MNKSQKHKLKKRIEEHSMEGSMILGPYKEPLQAVEKGYGYIGALTFDVKGRLQCHICGLLYDNLGLHLRAHEMTGREYKEKFKLAYSTKLISEAERERKKIAMMRWYLNLTPEQRAEGKKRMHEALKKNGRMNWAKDRKDRLALETKNKRGICPAQLIDIMRRAADEQGRLSRRDMMLFYKSDRYKKPIERTFGSWTRALEAAGLSSRGKGAKVGDKIPHYTDDTLLDLLRGHYDETGIMPSASDCTRGFLPSAGVFIKRFGSFPNARKAAGLPI
jgi:hypothetical protein